MTEVRREFVREVPATRWPAETGRLRVGRHLHGGEPGPQPDDDVLVRPVLVVPVRLVRGVGQGDLGEGQRLAGHGSTADRQGSSGSSTSNDAANGSGSANHSASSSSTLAGEPTVRAKGPSSSVPASASGPVGAAEAAAARAVAAGGSTARPARRR